jgi:hypothetical protein
MIRLVGLIRLFIGQVERLVVSMVTLPLEQVSLSLVSPPEEIHHAKICEALVVSSTSGQRIKKFDTVDMDGRLIAEAHTRVSLAHKIYMYENAKSIASKEKSWFQKMSQEADMDLEDNEDEIVYKEFSRQE